ncbi:MAG: hypothetical protein J6Y03_01085 [Alphaproteobacteria bacterium]|nr:hypothetical protein [Alphaproteobacteria bacterium]
MKLKKYILGCVVFLMSLFVPLQANAVPRILICLAIEALDKLVNPLPIVDGGSDEKALVTASEGVMNDLKSFTELLKYLEKLRKLALNPFSLAQDIEKVGVTSIENVTKGSQTVIDGFKGAAPGIVAGTVDFKNTESTKDAINKVAVVANPVGNVEKTVVKERRAAFIQQSLIDLHADILVAKDKLAKLKEADTSAQDSSSTDDTIGNLNVAIRMNSWENQVQDLEKDLAYKRMILEGIRNLKSADVLGEEVQVGGKND